ncbi:sulfite oxidase, partial [Kitasatospora sp. NPDC002965]
MPAETPSEAAYDRLRRRQWLAGEARADGVDRRTLLRMLAAAGVLAAPTAGGLLAPADAL